MTDTQLSRLTWIPDAVDPKSGTAEFKAAAIRIDKLDVADEVG